MSSQGCSGCAPRYVESFLGCGGLAVCRCKPRQTSGCCFEMPFVDGLMSAVTLTLTLTFTLTFTVRVCRAVGGAGPEWSDSDGCLTGGNAELMVPAAACASNPPGPRPQAPCCRCCPRPRATMCSSWTAGAWHHRRSLLPIHRPIEAGAAEQPPIPQFVSIQSRTGLPGLPQVWHFVYD